MQEVLAMSPLAPSCWEAEVCGAGFIQLVLLSVPLLCALPQHFCRRCNPPAHVHSLLLLLLLQVRLPVSSLPCTYKYGIRRADGSLHLEAGENRMVALPTNDGVRPPVLVARFDGCFRRQQRWRGAGVAAPVFSLRRCDIHGGRGGPVGPRCCSQARQQQCDCSAQETRSKQRCQVAQSPCCILFFRCHAIVPNAAASTTHPPAAARAWVQASFWTSCPWWTCVPPPVSASSR